MVESNYEMKAIGGYFELECGRAPLYYSDGIYLNICRNALRYLIRALGIKKLHVPLFTCQVVNDAIRQEGCDVLSYRLNANLMPIEDFPTDDFVLYNNYFGVLGNNVSEMAKYYPNLIVDNAQAFYSQPNCRAIIYSPRKFFGLPDGGILRGKDIPRLALEQGYSFEVTSHLLKRHDYGAQSSYSDFCRNDEALSKYPLERMSGLTSALMGNIDYEFVKQRRLENFQYIQEHLNSKFPINMADDDVPLVYPLMLEDGSVIRNRLIQNNIFCARYWPNVLDEAKETDREYNMAMNIVSLPVDQRYGKEDMERIIINIDRIRSTIR